jgi:hypothetical protein
MPRVWQIACGESGRKYSDLFVRHDVMFCGPGELGRFDEAVYGAALASGRLTIGEFTRIKKFATEVQPGDTVLLRSGYSIEAVGMVLDGYQHVPAFDDVFGWNLIHVRRVAWQHVFGAELAALQAEQPLFTGRKQIPTFTGVTDRSILEPIASLLTRCQSRTLADLPSELPVPLKPDELADALFHRGLGFDAVDRFRVALDKQRRLIEWYESTAGAEGRPTEHEVVAHIILPMLLALGWSEQLLAVEWNKIDLAIFNETPTDREHCRLVCEAKGMGHGLQNVFAQAVRYTETLRLTTCSKILLADGGRFYLYRRSPAGLWDDQPSGYLNVLKIRENHLLPAGTNAVDTIMALTPMRIAE